MYHVFRQNTGLPHGKDLTHLGEFKTSRKAAECIAEDIFELGRYTYHGESDECAWNSVLIRVLHAIRSCSWRPGDFVPILEGYIVKRSRYNNAPLLRQ